LPNQTSRGTIAGMSVLYLTEDQVAQLLPMTAAITALERAFAALAAGEVQDLPRRRVRTSGVVLHSMSAAAEYFGLVGWKQYTTSRQGARFHVGVHCGKSGQLLALLAADRLGQIRTGAATGVAIRHLAPPGADALALIGAGWQAETQLRAAACELNLRRVRVFSRDENRRRDFADRLTSELGIDVHAAASAADATAGCPVVITATSAKKSVVADADLSDAQLLCAIGSNWPHRRELPSATIARAKRVVCDSLDACRAEAGDLILADNEGAFSWDRAEPLSQVVAEGEANRRGAAGGSLASGSRGLIVFKSVGLALEDLAVAAHVIERARKQGVGQVLPIG